MHTKVSWILGYLPPIFPKIGGFPLIQKRSSPVHHSTPVLKFLQGSPLPVLGGLQVQDPGGRPGHCAQDHEDPNLEADAEEGVGLPAMAGPRRSMELLWDSQEGEQ